MTPLATARATVAARMRKQADALRDAADRIEAGEDDAWAVAHEIKRMEGERVDQPS